MYFKFADYYLQNNPSVKSVTPNDELFIQFQNFLRDKNFTYESQIEKKINEIEQLASEKKYKMDISNMLEKVELEAELGEQKEFELAKAEVLQNIFNEINNRIINEEEQYEAILPFDIQLQKAVSILENKSEYNSLLGK